MLVRRHRQTCLSQLVLFGTLHTTPEELMDPVLRRLDRLLDDDRFIDPIADAMARRWPNSRRTGRSSTPAETVLRMLVLRVVRRWTWQQLVWEVEGNVVYRRFCRIDGHSVPRDKTLIKLNKLIDPQALQRIFDVTVTLAVEQRVTRGKKMRLDTTVVEGPIRFPLDNRLLEDGVRVLSRGVRKLKRAGVDIGLRFRNVKRSVSRAMRAVAAALTKKTRDLRKKAIEKPYRRLLAITARVARQTDAALVASRAQLETLPVKTRALVQRLVGSLATMVERVRQVIRQTRARVLRGQTRSDGKIVSIYEPWVEIFRRGKKHRPTEFGKLVRVQEAEGGIVTDIGIAPEKADAPLLEPGLRRHQQVFGRAPDLVATDRGFFSIQGERALMDAGVRYPVIPKPGHVSATRRAHENQQWFRRGRAWRAGGEARIAYLKHGFGMLRSRGRGEAALAQTVLWAGIANNLVTTARRA